MFSDECIKKFTEFKNIIDYISSYQAIYNKVVNLVQSESQIRMQSFKLLL